MHQEQSPPEYPVLSYLIAIGTLALIILLLSCNEAKKIQQAEQRVRLNPASFENVGKTWAALNPCTTDTSYITTQGETLVFIDTVRTHTQDTANYYRTDTITITKTRTRIDTMVLAITDTRALKIANDSIQSSLRIAARLEGVLQQKDITIKEAEQRATKLLYWLFGIGLAITALIVFWIVIKLKPL